MTTPHMSALAVMEHLRKNYHTVRAFPLIEPALRGIDAPTFLAYLSGCSADMLGDTSRSLGVWARYPSMTRSICLGHGSGDNQVYELAKMTWDATMVETRDLVHTASIVYGSMFKREALRVTYSGGTGSAYSTMDRLVEICVSAAEVVPRVRDSLSQVPFPEPYLAVLAATVSVLSATEGVSGDKVVEGVESALEVVPTFTVEGEPIRDLINAALEEWAFPLMVVGMTWEKVRENEDNTVGAFRGLAAGSVR